MQVTAQPNIDRVVSFAQSRVMWALYTIALGASIAAWLIAVRAPLRIDETGSYWQITGGISEIWSRQLIFLSPSAYIYILWLTTKLLGTSEIALRIPSILAMLGAVYLLYLCGRKLVDSEFAVIAAIVFSLNLSVVFGAIDVRPYGFAVLFTNAAILVLLHLRTSDSNWLAALFGLLAAGTVHFHYLFAAVLPALLLCLFVFKSHCRKTLVRQCCISLVVFAVACIPLLPGLQYLFRTSGTHVAEPYPGLSELLLTFMPGWLIPAVALTALSFIATNQTIGKAHIEKWKILFGGCLALVPVIILYAVSVGTPLHVFTASYHRLSAIPGISLCWAMALYRFRSTAVRAISCVIFAGLTMSSCLLTPIIMHHDYSWKCALQAVEDMSSKDHAPVAICSNYIEANYARMPAESPKTDRLFAQLSYYKITSPIVPLPEALNDETKRVFLPFLREAAQKHERFFAVGHEVSFPALDWITEAAAGEYSARTVGIYDHVKVLEFVPREKPDIATK